MSNTGVSGNDFWSFGNGNGSAHSQTLGTRMKNFNPNFWERERENSIPNFWEREWKFHSRILGTGMRRCYSREWERELHRKIEWKFFIIPLFNPTNILHCNRPQICSQHLNLYELSLSHLTFHSTGQVSNLYLIV